MRITRTFCHSVEASKKEPHLEKTTDNSKIYQMCEGFTPLGTFWKKIKILKILANPIGSKGKQNLLEILEDAKNEDDSFIKNVELIKKGYDVGSDSVATSYSSNPKKNPLNWKKKFHPLFGLSHHFEPILIVKSF